jgi:hypothetical protein
MQSKGINQLKDSTKKNIRHTLNDKLGNCIEIISDNKGKLLVIPNTLTVKDVVMENQCLKAELTLWKANSNVNNIIELASMHLRQNIMMDEKETQWPLHPENIDPNFFKVPEYLNKFFLGLLRGNSNAQDSPQRISRLVQSFSQDMIYAVTCGKQKTPKQVLLTYAVKTLIGNIEIIKTLNRLGHGISYSQVEENDTALCLQKLASNQSIIPANIHPHVFTNLAWDNIDRLEETLTGKGTSHRVNGIAIQAPVFGPHLPRVFSKTKQRSITVQNDDLPVYIAGERKGPVLPIESFQVVHEYEDDARIAQNKNLVWLIARQDNTEQQKIPSWTGFNIKTRNSVIVSEDFIGYLPTINAPATDLATVFEILNQSEVIRESLQLPKIVVVMDQALFAKASEIIWKHKERYVNVILRMGAFHTICNFMSILGKRFMDAGLRDICIESGILAEGSTIGVLEGKMYNRAVHVHKCIYEAMMRLIWIEFVTWTNNKENEAIDSFLIEMNVLIENVCQSNLEMILKSLGFEILLDLWKKFLNYLRHDNGDLSAFWMSYIDMVEGTLLNLLRASRERNWNLHLFSIKSMIPWCFAYDKMNYARYLTVYLSQMELLPIEHPEVHQHFLNGSFSTQMSNNNPFGCIPVDQTIEVTVNKDTQTQGGTTKFSLKPGAVKRYYITAEYRSAFLNQLRKFVDVSNSEFPHTDLQSTRMQNDEDAVSRVVSTIKNWINPFSQKHELVIISTGIEATPNIKTDLLNAIKVGEHKYENFKTEQFKSMPPIKKFYDPMKLCKLQTFSSMCKKQVISCQGRSIILKADRALFGKIIVIAQTRNLRMQDILCHSLGPLPWPLATPEGLLRKTNKATLAAYLQKDIPTVESIPLNSATIIDGMNLVQRIKGHQINFGEVATDLLSMILREGHESNRIDVVFDRYQGQSIKNSERMKRGQHPGINPHNYITAALIVRQWRKFLEQTSNKTALIFYLVAEWKKPQHSERLKNKILYVTCEEKCFKITYDSNQEILDLSSTHEEADGRLLLHANHAAKEGCKAILISSGDTDVLILCLAFQDFIKAPLFQKSSNTSRTKILDIRKIAHNVGNDVCKALIGFHAFTGCDVVSSFAGKGKIGALKLLNTNNSHDIFTNLGSEWAVSEEMMQKLEQFTCSMYSTNSHITMINELRYHLFCAKNGEIESHQLPPCQDSLKKHIQRANYQAAIWKRSLENDPGTLTPIGRGWKYVKVNGEEQLEIDWMDSQPAPQAVLDLLACTCTKICKLPKCICLSNNMKCTDMCKLKNCSNQDEFDFHGF